MKRKYLLVVLIIIVLFNALFLQITCSSNRALEMPVDSIKFRTLKKDIALIEIKVVDLTSPNDLLLFREFNDLVNKFSLSDSVVSSYISSPEISDQQKSIAIYALRNLDFKNYIKFYERCLRLFKDGKISQNLLITVLCPGSNWNCSIVQNYQTEDVKNLLGNSYRDMSDEMKEVYKSILSGELWKSIEDERNIERMNY